MKKSSSLLITVGLLISSSPDAISAPIFGQTGFPGPSPGPARFILQEGAITFANAIFSVHWQITERGLRLQSATDVITQDSLNLSGQMFEIILAEGRRYPASDFKPEKKPRLTALRPQPKASRLAARIPGAQVELPLLSTDERLRVTWRAIAHENANYLRQEVEVTPLREECVVQEIFWLHEPIAGATTVGRVDGSPVTAGNFFFGVEDPLSLNLVKDDMVSCRVRPEARLRKKDSLTQSFVLGVAPPAQMRRAFLYYLERERAHPYRPFLHYNSWYDIAWDLFTLNETNCSEAIRLWGDNFIKPHGVKMDALVFDDGWDNPKSLWNFHAGFPNGFKPLARLCQEYGTQLGVWLSPFGGYAEARAQRLKYGAEQGYETNTSGFSLAGPKYYAAFKSACVKMIRQYQVNHFKFDGLAAGAYANGPGPEYMRDSAALRGLMLELRAEDPDLYINFTTGSWPSPFWLRYADSLWRQGGDMGFAGPGSKQQQWLTYRDQEVYRNIVHKGPLYPLNALMTQGVAYSRLGMAGDPIFNSAGFKDDVRAFFGGGTGLQELYIQPGKLTAENWKVLAEAARWSRDNADVLADTHWVGGDPSKLEVYGYASWTPRKAILMLRNPNTETREFELEAGRAFELPETAQRKFTLTSPWAEDAQKPPIQAQAGQPARLTLAPFEVLVLEARSRE